MSDRTILEALFGPEPRDWPAWSCSSCGQRNSGWTTECGRCDFRRLAPALEGARLVVVDAPPHRPNLLAAAQSVQKAVKRASEPCGEQIIHTWGREICDLPYGPDGPHWWPRSLADDAKRAPSNVIRRAIDELQPAHDENRIYQILRDELLSRAPGVGGDGSGSGLG